MRTSKQISEEIKAKIAASKKIHALQNESVSGYDYTDTPEIRALMAEFDAASESEFRAEWTAEVTAARKTEWNTSGVTPRTVPQIEKRLGYTMIDLQKAAQMYK